MDKERLDALTNNMVSDLCMAARLELDLARQTREGMNPDIDFYRIAFGHVDASIEQTKKIWASLLTP